MRIPFCLLEFENAKKKSQRFLGMGNVLSKFFPNLKLTLSQAEIDADPETYMSIAFFSGILMFLMTFLPIAIISISMVELLKAFSISTIIGFIMFFVTVFYIAIYPKSVVNKKISNLDRNLIYALKHLYVEVKGGVPLFDAIVSVSRGKYGRVSDVLSIIIKRVNLGMSIEEALFKSSEENPSVYYRRIIWEMTNGMKEGSKVSDIIKASIENLSIEQKIAIREYGAKLNPMTMVYMMIAVIIPALGITFLIIMSVFSGMSVSKNMFIGILIGLAIFQMMFLGMMKSMRPNIV